jgi:CTP synthase (UTP-ammonia lyase)
MPGSIDNLIPTAKQIQKEAALKEAEKADQYARLAAAAEAEKRALIERLNRPSGKSEEEKIQLASTVIQRAVRNGMTEVQVYRFPNSLCSDKGRAIIQQEKGWENTLTGIPKEIFQLWTDYLKPRGYRISYQVIEYPGGVPGDIAITIAWG